MTYGCLRLSAIKINAAEPRIKGSSPGSKFFGDPVVPYGWQEIFSDDVIFFAPIKFSDIALLDTENKLPHTGYFYLFLDAEMYPYQAMAYYYGGEPNTVIDDFNAVEPRFAHLTEELMMSFEPCDDTCEGTRLFGCVQSGCCENGEVLLQFDPIENETGFLDSIDGYVYFLFGEDGRDIDGISFFIDRS